jgi:mitotic spindle assembly checkpoint protein MAD1
LENQKREFEKLQETMRNRDKAFDRLKEAFGAKATEYVAAVKALFGYDMHVISKGKVKIRSIYARTSKGTSLTFDSGEDSNGSNMKLVGEARQGVAVKNLQEYWLGNDRFSVPCFLAALQLELYEGTTRAVRPTWEAEEDE